MGTFHGEIENLCLEFEAKTFGIILDHELEAVLGVINKILIDLLCLEILAVGQMVTEN